MMKKIEYCYECDCDVEVITKCEENRYTYRDREFVVLENIDYCPNCNSALLDANLDESMYDIYNGYLKLYDLSFEIFKEIRTKLNLSQDVMSKILGWSKKSIVRYENAESVPQGEYLNIYKKLKDNIFYIIKILENKKEELGEEYYDILKKLPFYDKYKTVNSVLYLLDNNSLYETSLMKNLFTVDFECVKESGRPITDLRYVHMKFGPVIDNRFDLYNFLIKNEYIELEQVEFDTGTKFKNICSCDEKLFSDDELRVLDLVKNKLKKYGASSLSDWSHKFKGWKDTKDGEVISYDYAPYLDINDL